MLRSLFTISLCVIITSVFAQNKIKGSVFENTTRIKLAGIHVNNLNNSQSTLTNNDGKFTITAKPGDLLTFNALFYDADTVLVTDLHEMEVFLTPHKNELNQVNITTTESPGMSGSYYDPQFHGQTLVYHRDKKGAYDGGLTLRMWYWKKDARKKAREEKKIKDFEKADHIAKTFTPKVIATYLPLTGQDMINFISLYTPSVKVYTDNDFNLVQYLNSCYKKYLKLPEDKKSLPPLPSLSIEK
ncbi:carboxypeptidase-like regulatory domain-containing protein [Mucilaginibacter segetis]|uniref:Carboxypeptidase-like regulatory domain-containing protein n=1 Tax=Mucilaginibacter segetis TaxID=2793071 RepID=A0A934PPI3_9SPHI|nr:carboxypeptidase-like regulatory domain-containing protein [Mucilaginibacter segetis]MBK0377714.1 carboxypeptidase-like regulatory domain-containing protein [Mucilaginibacter segetis]